MDYNFHKQPLNFESILVTKKSSVSNELTEVRSQ